MFYTIESGSYTASIDTFGAAIGTVKRNDVNLVEPRIDPAFYGGVVLAPWPNRQTYRP